MIESLISVRQHRPGLKLALNSRKTLTLTRCHHCQKIKPELGPEEQMLLRILIELLDGMCDGFSMEVEQIPKPLKMKTLLS
jgi:hypothetical protein